MNDPFIPHYFAASNSSRGFQNYYGDCFSPARADRLYILKGGPGTGKSHFLRTVARRAAAVGYAVTAYDCSSDPSSLDGVLLARPGSPTIGLLDGTAPHVCEPVTPGVREEMVNLGAFWNSSALAAGADAVHRLADKKSEAYARAYAYLRAAGELDAIADSLLSPAVREESLTALATRLLRAIPKGKDTPADRPPAERIPALRRALGMTGRVTHHTFEQMADTLVVIEDHYGLGARLLSHLSDLTAARGDATFVSYDPVYPAKTDGLYYPAARAAILLGHAEPREGCPTRTVTLTRYVDPDRLHPVRGELRHTLRLRARLEDDALHALASAATAHFDLEAIYAAAMDFPAKEAFTDAFCQDLFGGTP